MKAHSKHVNETKGGFEVWWKEDSDRDSQEHATSEASAWIDPLLTRLVVIRGLSPKVLPGAGQVA